jgi:hypothetical protein
MTSFLFFIFEEFENDVNVPVLSKINKQKNKRYLFFLSYGCLAELRMTIISMRRYWYANTSFNFAVNPYSTFHFNADPDPNFHFHCGAGFCASSKSFFFMSVAIVLPQDSVFINVSEPN